MLLFQKGLQAMFPRSSNQIRSFSVRTLPDKISREAIDFSRCFGLVFGIVLIQEIQEIKSLRTQQLL